MQFFYTTFFFSTVMGSRAFRIVSTIPNAQHPIVIQIEAAHPPILYYCANRMIPSTCDHKTSPTNLTTTSLMVIKPQFLTLASI